MTDNAMSPAAADSERHEMEKAKGDDFTVVREALDSLLAEHYGCDLSCPTKAAVYSASDALSRIEADAGRSKENLSEAWAAISLMHEQIGDLLPPGCLASEEAINATSGPTFSSYAQRIVEAVALGQSATARYAAGLNAIQDGAPTEEPDIDPLDTYGNHDDGFSDGARKEHQRLAAIARAALGGVTPLSRIEAENRKMREALERCESRMSGHPMWDSDDAGPSKTLQMVRAALDGGEK
jgi:hypothetical protein